MATPVLFTAMTRNVFAGAVHPNIDKAREELIEMFNEGKVDNMLLMFLVPLKEAK